MAADGRADSLECLMCVLGDLGDALREDKEGSAALLAEPRTELPMAMGPLCLEETGGGASAGVRLPSSTELLVLQVMLVLPLGTLNPLEDALSPETAGTTCSDTCRLGHCATAHHDKFRDHEHSRQSSDVGAQAFIWLYTHETVA